MRSERPDPGAHLKVLGTKAEERPRETSLGVQATPRAPASPLRSAHTCLRGEGALRPGPAARQLCDLGQTK